MLKKIVLLFSLSILLFSFFVSPIFAYVWSPSEKDNLKMYLRASGEKLGMNWTEKSLDATTNFLINKANLEEAEGLTGNLGLIRDWSNYMAETDFVDGVATINMKPSEFMAHMKLLKDTVEEMKDGEIVEASCIKPQFTYDRQQNALGFWIHYKSYSVDYLIVFYNATPTINTLTNKSFNLSNTGGFQLWQINSAKTRATLINDTSQSSVSQATEEVYGYSSGACQQPINETHRPITQNINPIITNYLTIDNSYYNDSETVNMVVRQNYNDFTTIINEPMTEEEFEKITNPSEPVPVPEPDEKPEGSSWWEWLIKPIAKAIEGLGDILKSVLGLVTTLIDSLSDLFISLFIPDGDTITMLFGEVQESFNAKIPMVSQLQDFFGQISESTTGTPVEPKFEITLPENYGGGTFSIIDFSYFADYRQWVLNFIRFIAWFVFLKRLYNRVPKMIY